MLDILMSMHPVVLVFIYFVIGAFVATLIDGWDGDHFIGFAIFWPVIVGLFVVCLVFGIPMAIAQAIHEKICKK